MTRRGSYPLDCHNPNAVLVAGSFRPNGATGVVSGSLKGRGFSVARSSVGKYVVTLDQKFNHLVAAVGSGRSVDGETDLSITFGAYSAANKTIEMYVHKKAVGFIPLDITSAREIATNAIQNLAAHGGILASDSVPALARVNGATDKALRLVWAATEQDEIQFPPVPKPPDLDASSDLSVHLMIDKDTNTDTAAVVDVQAWDGIGDTEMGGNTAALATADLTEYSVTIANANVAAHPGFLNVGIVPGAHANDAIRLYAAWIEYVQKTLTDLAADADNVVNFQLAFQRSVLPVT